MGFYLHQSPRLASVVWIIFEVHNHSLLPLNSHHFQSVTRRMAVYHGLDSLDLGLFA